MRDAAYCYRQSSLSVGLSHLWTLKKRLNWPSCRLGWRLGWVHVLDRGPWEGSILGMEQPWAVQNGRTDRDAVWDAELGKQPCIRRGCRCSYRKGPDTLGECQPVAKHRISGDWEKVTCAKIGGPILTIYSLRRMISFCTRRCLLGVAMWLLPI